MVDVREPVRRRFSRHEYYQMEFLGERVELIDGEIYETPPIGPDHSRVTTKLHRVIERVIQDAFHVRDGQPLDLGDSQPQPDLAVVAGHPDDYRSRHPTSAILVVEVAQSSIRFDQTVKGPFYAQAGIPEYWIVDLVGKQVIVHCTPESGEYREVTTYLGDDLISPEGLAGVSIKVSDIF